MAGKRVDHIANQLPEKTTYRDEGCDLAPSCLNCPFPKCRYDDPGFLSRWNKNGRDEQIVASWNQGALGPKELSRMFSVSRRTVHRILKNVR